jgi:hypothetical protein
MLFLSTVSSINKIARFNGAVLFMLQKDLQSIVMICLSLMFYTKRCNLQRLCRERYDIKIDFILV